MSSYQRYLSNPAENGPLNQRIQSSGWNTRSARPHFRELVCTSGQGSNCGTPPSGCQAQCTQPERDAFVALHREFLDTEANGETMNRTPQTLYEDISYTPGRFEQAYAVLRANDALDLNQTVIVQMEQAAADERPRVARERTEGHSVQELNEMDLEDLRRLDAIGNRKRAGRR